MCTNTPAATYPFENATLFHIVNVYKLVTIQKRGLMERAIKYSLENNLGNEFYTIHASRAHHFFPKMYFFPAFYVHMHLHFVFIRTLLTENFDH